VETKRAEIQEMVDRETEAWDTQDVTLLLSVFHPHMVCPWPLTSDDHDPVAWVMVLGKFDAQRWGRFYEQFFREHHLVHNERRTIRIKVSDDGEGAFAVVNIDTLWVDTRRVFKHWLGRVCKVYALMGDEWKMTMHTGALRY
jgi:hypothetical protein